MSSTGTDRMLAFEQRFFLVDHNLIHTDRMPMAAGVEVRVRALARRWMRHEPRELLGDVLSVESLTRRGVFEPVGVQRLIAANDEGWVDASYTLLSLLCIEISCWTFIDDFPSVSAQ